MRHRWGLAAGRSSSTQQHSAGKRMRSLPSWANREEQNQAAVMHTLGKVPFGMHWPEWFLGKGWGQLEGTRARPQLLHFVGHRCSRQRIQLGKGLVDSEAP